MATKKKAAKPAQKKETVKKAVSKKPKANESAIQSPGATGNYYH